MSPHFFVFEFITGGGLLGSGDVPSGSLLAEGQAMLAAAVADLTESSRAASGHSTPARVSVLWDDRLPRPSWHGVTVYPVREPDEVRQNVQRLAAAAQWTVVIAPELERHLENWGQHILDAGGRWLGGSMDWVRRMADKQTTAEWLVSRGIPVPRGTAVGPGDRWPEEIGLPAVWKPRLGAGSVGVQRIDRQPDFVDVVSPDCSQLPGGDVSVPAGTGASEGHRPWRLETWMAGVPASVAVLAGPAGSYVLPPMRQLLAGHTGLQYQGGCWPLEPALRTRAMQLAARVARCADADPDGALGYYGIDLVLGNAPDGSQDAVIEVNPRFTTSYVGLRAAASGNLANYLVGLARGADHAELSVTLGPLAFDAQPLTFRADGSIVRGPRLDRDLKSAPLLPLWVPRASVGVRDAVIEEVVR